MTPKGWTQEETIALLTIVHMSTELDGPKTDEDLANILNQKVAQGHLKRNLNTDNPFNKLIVRQRVYNLMENGIVPTIGQMRVKRKESPNMRPEEVTAWFAAEAGFHFIPQEQDVSSINGKQSLAMQPSPSSQPIPPLQQSYVPGMGGASDFGRQQLPPTFLPPRQEISVPAIAGPLSSRGARGLGMGKEKSQRHHPYGGRHQLKPQSRPLNYQQQTKPTPTPAQAHVPIQKLNGPNMGGTKNSHGHHGQGMAGHHPPSSNPQAPPHRESQQPPSMVAPAPAPPPILQLNGSSLNGTSHTSPHQQQPRPHPKPLISQSSHPHLAHLFRPSLREPSSRNGLTISGQEPLADLGRRSIELPSIKSPLLIGDFTSPDHPKEWRTVEPGSDWVRVGAVHLEEKAKEIKDRWWEDKQM
jgi:hypothetical protein